VSTALTAGALTGCIGGVSVCELPGDPLTAVAPNSCARLSPVSGESSYTGLFPCPPCWGAALLSWFLGRPHYYLAERWSFRIMAGSECCSVENGFGEFLMSVGFNLT